MKKAFAIGAILTLFAGCNTDIVTTDQLKTVKNKCVYVTPIESRDPSVGKVLKDILEKEFVRKNIRLCDADNANVILTGSAFLTTRTGGTGWTGLFDFFNEKPVSAQAIESVTITAKDKSGNILLTASYNNSELKTTSKFAKDFGSTLADKLR
ncbi:MAG: hypothetical protein WBL85_05055 [Sedimentisphaerales bacterium]